MPFVPSEDAPKNVNKQAIHFQARINPVDDRAIHEWLENSLANYQDVAGSAMRALLCDMVQYFIDLERKQREPQTVNVDAEKVDEMLTALQTIQSQLENGVVTTSKGGKKQKKIEMPNNIAGIINRYAALGESEDGDEQH